MFHSRSSLNCSGAHVSPATPPHWVSGWAAIAAAVCCLTIALPARAQSTSSSLNFNQQSMSDAIRTVTPTGPVGLCPQLKAENNGTGPAPGTVERDLFVRCSRIVNADNTDQKSTALQEVTAAELNAATTNSLSFSRAQRTNIAGRLVTLRGGLGGGALAQNLGPGSISASSTGGASGEEAGRLGMFLNGGYGSGNKDLTPDEAAYDFTHKSVTAGVDYRFTDSLVGGVAIGYNKSNSDYKGGGSLDDDGVTGSLFASWYGPKYYLDFIAGYGSLNFDSSRRVAYTVTVSNPASPVKGTDSIDYNARGSTDGSTYSAGLSAGYDFGNGAWRWGPTAAVSYVKANVNGYQEKGGTNPELNLLYKDQSAKSLQFQLGLDVAYTASVSWGVIAPYARAAYVAETENNRDSFYIFYANDPFKTDQTRATVRSDKPDSSFFVWAVGLSSTFANGFSGFVDYQSVASLSSITYGEAAIGLRYEFR